MPPCSPLLAPVLRNPQNPHPGQRKFLTTFHTKIGPPIIAMLIKNQSKPFLLYGTGAQQATECACSLERFYGQLPRRPRYPRAIL